MFTRTIIMILLVGLMGACSEKPQQQALLDPAPPAEVTIIDRVSGWNVGEQDAILLDVELTSEQETEMRDLCEVAALHFPDGYWVNYGPDSAYREITICCSGREYVLRSWHPLYESNPNLVVGSYGVTSLNGQTREEVLSHDKPEYIAQRNAFDEIDRELRRRFGDSAAPPVGGEDK